MPVCDTCGNSYDKTFGITLDGRDYTFDSFECAISKLAPECGRCGVRILGHGVEAEGTIYCGAHCAGQTGEKRLQDRA